MKQIYVCATHVAVLIIEEIINMDVCMFIHVHKLCFKERLVLLFHSSRKCTVAGNQNASI